MRNGFRVYDSDTHVNPAAEVLDRYVDPDFRPRLAELEPYRLPVGQAVEGNSGLHNYRVGTKYYRRVLGEKAPRETFTGRETRWMGTKMPRPGHPGRPGRQPRPRHGRRRHGCSFPDPDLVAQHRRAAGPGARDRRHSRLPPPHGRFLRAIPDPAEEHDRRLVARRAGGGAPNPRMGQVEMGGGGDAALGQGRAGRPPGPRPDLAGRRRARFADRQPQLHLEPALLSGLPGFVGEHLPRPGGRPPLGGDALCRLVHRRRDL